MYRTRETGKLTARRRERRCASTPFAVRLPGCCPTDEQRAYPYKEEEKASDLHPSTTSNKPKTRFVLAVKPYARLLNNVNRKLRGIQL